MNRIWPSKVAARKEIRDAIVRRSSAAVAARVTLWSFDAEAVRACHFLSVPCCLCLLPGLSVSDDPGAEAFTDGARRHFVRNRTANVFDPARRVENRSAHERSCPHLSSPVPIGASLTCVSPAADYSAANRARSNNRGNRVFSICVTHTVSAISSPAAFRLRGECTQTHLGLRPG